MALARYLQLQTTHPFKNDNHHRVKKLQHETNGAENFYTGPYTNTKHIFFQVKAEQEQWEPGAPENQLQQEKGRSKKSAAK
ncbi:MAG: hypothetical protein LJE74_10675 [Proteobacteria bacterium]|nr:hypothetical protein [Pseudomonadota bacterium]